MVLIAEDQFEVVVTFFEFVASHVELGQRATIDGAFAVLDPVVGDCGCDFEPAFFVELRDSFLAGPHHGDPVFVNFCYFVFWDAGGFAALLLFKAGFASSAFWCRFH